MPRPPLARGFINELDGLRGVARTRILRLEARFSSVHHPAEEVVRARRSAIRTAVTVALVLCVLAVGCRQGAATSLVDAPRADAGVAANGPGADGPPEAPLPAAGAVLYPEGTRHSPIPPTLAARLQMIAGSFVRAEHVFAKVGDSITATSELLACFDGGPLELGVHGALAPTLAYFAQGNAAGTSPYARWSIAAVGGMTARDPLIGDPSTLERELAAIDPRFALVMFGTNDVRYRRTLDAFGADLWTIIDYALARGTIPIVSTIPASADPGSDAQVPTFNRVARAIAQGRGIPLIDLHHELAPLPERGLSSDGLHPSVAPGGACLLTTDGLRFGHNVRNLLTMEALARVLAALAGDAPDATAEARSGTGVVSDPFTGRLPLVDLRDVRDGDAVFAGYGCGGRAQAGHELVYRIELPTATALAAHVVDRDGVDVDVHVLAGALAPEACIASGDRSVRTTAGPGTVYVIVDAAEAGSEGEFLLVVEAG